jgi:hypothetical protein
VPCVAVAAVDACDLLVGFAAAYDAAGNKTYERPLHAGCRAAAYVVRDDYGTRCPGRTWPAGWPGLADI